MFDPCLISKYIIKFSGVTGFTNKYFQQDITALFMTLE